LVFNGVITLLLLISRLVLGTGTRFSTRFPGTRSVPGYCSILALILYK